MQRHERSCGRVNVPEVLLVLEPNKKMKELGLQGMLGRGVETLGACRERLVGRAGHGWVSQMR